MWHTRTQNSRVAEGTATEQNGDIDLHCYAPTYSPTPTSFPEQLMGTCWRSLNKRYIWNDPHQIDRAFVALIIYSFVGANITRKRAAWFTEMCSKQNDVATGDKSNGESRHQEFKLARKVSDRWLKHWGQPLWAQHFAADIAQAEKYIYQREHTSDLTPFTTKIKAEGFLMPACRALLTSSCRFLRWVVKWEKRFVSVKKARWPCTKTWYEWGFWCCCGEEVGHIPNTNSRRVAKVSQNWARISVVTFEAVFILSLWSAKQAWNKKTHL